MIFLIVITILALILITVWVINYDEIQVHINAHDRFIRWVAFALLFLWLSFGGLFYQSNYSVIDEIVSAREGLIQSKALEDELETQKKLVDSLPGELALQNFKLEQIQNAIKSKTQEHGYISKVEAIKKTFNSQISEEKNKYAQGYDKREKEIKSKYRSALIQHESKLKEKRKYLVQNITDFEAELKELSVSDSIWTPVKREYIELQVSSMQNELDALSNNAYAGVKTLEDYRYEMDKKLEALIENIERAREAEIAKVDEEYLSKLINAKAQLNKDISDTRSLLASAKRRVEIEEPRLIKLRENQKQFENAVELGALKSNAALYIKALCLGGLGAILTLLVVTLKVNKQLVEYNEFYSVVFSNVLVGAIVSVAGLALMHTSFISVFPVAEVENVVPDEWKLVVICLVLGAFSMPVYTSAKKVFGDFLDETTTEKSNATGTMKP